MRKLTFKRACAALLVLTFTLSLLAHATSGNFTAAAAGMLAGTGVAGDCATCVHDSMTSSTCSLLCLNIMAIGQTVTVTLAGIKRAYDKTSFQFVPTLLVYIDLDPPRHVTSI